jgi:hypothetical protein
MDGTCCDFAHFGTGSIAPFRMLGVSFQGFSSENLGATSTTSTGVIVGSDERNKGTFVLFSEWRKTEFVWDLWLLLWLWELCCWWFCENALRTTDWMGEWTIQRFISKTK